MKVVPAKEALAALEKTGGEVQRLLQQARGVVQRLQDTGHEAYFVGGAVRDLLLGRPFVDIDITTSAEPHEVKELFSRTIAMGESFGVMTVMRAGLPFEVATFRCEEGYTDGRHPDEVRVGTLEEDVLRRDFTVNGLVLDPVSGQVIDLVDGLVDLEAGVIRAIGDPAARLSEDYLRTLRAVRFAAVLGFAIEPATQSAVRLAAPGLERISRERVRNEMMKLVVNGAVAAGLLLSAETDLTEGIFGAGVSASAMVEAARVLQSLEVRPGLPEVLAAVNVAAGRAPGSFVGSGNAARRRLESQAQGLRLSNPERRRLRDIYQVLASLPGILEVRLGERAELYRLPAFAAALSLARAQAGTEALRDHLAQVARDVGGLPARRLAGVSPLSGNDLMAMGYAAGPGLGELLKELSCLVVEGTIASRDDAIAWLKAHGPEPRR